MHLIFSKASSRTFRLDIMTRKGYDGQLGNSSSVQRVICCIHCVRKHDWTGTVHDVCSRLPCQSIPIDERFCVVIDRSWIDRYQSIPILSIDIDWSISIDWIPRGSFSCSKYDSHWLIGYHVALYKFKCILSGIHWGERDQWPETARDQNVTKTGGMIVAWCFEAHFSAISQIPGNLSLVLRKFLKHIGTVWG